MIELKNVSKIYKNNVIALNNISLSIEKGELVYLAGKSGAGKSTLLKLLYKQEESSAGIMKVDGQTITKMARREVYKLRRKVGIVFQDFKLLPSKTVFENVAYVLEVVETPDEEIVSRVLEVLEIVDMVDRQHHYPHNLSIGEQQRAAIARAIINKPVLMMADEPTGNLDPKNAEEIMRLFYRINQHGTTVLMATHSWQLIEKFPSRVIEMQDGKVISDRSKNHIKFLTSQDFNDILFRLN